MQSQGAADNAAETARSETGVADEPRPVRYVAADEAVLYALYVPSGTPQYFIPRVQSAAIRSAFVHAWAVTQVKSSASAKSPGDCALPCNRSRTLHLRSALCSPCNPRQLAHSCSAHANAATEAFCVQCSVAFGEPAAAPSLAAHTAALPVHVNATPAFPSPARSPHKGRKSAPLKERAL